MRPEHARPTLSRGEQPAPRPALLSRLPAWAWIAIGIVAAALAVVLAPLLVLASLAVLITGIVGVVRQTPTWLRLHSRRAAILVTAGSAVVLVLASGVTSLTQQHETGPVADAPLGFAAAIPSHSAPASAPASVSSATPSPEPTPVIVVSEVTATEPIAFTESIVEDNTIPQGETRVLTPGQNGESAVVYRVTTVDGVETERVEASRTTTVEPVAQVIAHGTYVPPQTFVGSVERGTGTGMRSELRGRLRPDRIRCGLRLGQRERTGIPQRRRARRRFGHLRPRPRQRRLGLRAGLTVVRQAFREIHQSVNSTARPSWSKRTSHRLS